jgi:ribosome-associated toxin RatA of RatAB toxin-antitoxin module
VRSFAITTFVDEEPAVAYSRLADFRCYPELAPSVLAVEVEYETEDPGSTSCRSTWEVAFRSGVMRWREIDRFDRDRLAIEFEQESGDLAVLRGHWLVAERVGGAEITFAIEFDLGLPGLETFLEPVAERALRDNIHELVSRLFTSAEFDTMAEPA